MNQNFLPVKIHIKQQPGMFHRFEANWTPTIIVLDPDGHERYRFSGYLPVDDFLVQLKLGLAYSAFAHKNWGVAGDGFRDVAGRSKDEAGPESTYWAGVSKYKASHNPADLQDIARQLNQRYPGSTWAKRASVWLAEEKAA